MKLTGEERIAASRERVWEALNDPEVLRQCIPGCKSLEKESDDRFKATVSVKIGPIGAQFNGAVTLSDQDPPNGYKISGEGSAGAAGFAKGTADVSLVEDGSDTVLTYEVEAQTGGRIAQLGGAIVDQTAKQLASRFFKKFGEIVVQPEPEAAAPAAASAPQATPVQPAPKTTSPSTSPPPSSTYTPPSASSKSEEGLPMKRILALAGAALIGFLIGRAHGGDGSVWAGIAIGLIVIIVAAVAFEYGRKSTSQTVVLDRNLLDQIVNKSQDKS